MNQTMQSILRAVLMLAGALLIGHHIYSTTVTPEWWDMVSGVLLSVVTAAWGIFQKSATQDMIVAAVKQLAVLVLGIYAASGKLSSDQAATWVGIIGTIVTTILSIVYKQKSNG